MCEALLQRQDEVSQGVNWEVFSQRGGGAFPSPVKGEIHRGKALCEVPGRVLGPQGGEGGEGRPESG